MKILVTGGAGFIGSHVVEEHTQQGDEVFVVDDLSMGSEQNLPKSKSVHFFHESITNNEFMADLLIKEQFDVIYLLAAIASVADTIERPYESHLVNQEANIQILEVIRVNKLQVKRVVFASSAAVYGTLPDLPKQEMGPVEPATAYAIDKYATERFVLSYAELYSIPAVAVRFFNVYGPRQNPKSPYSGVLSIVANALKTDSVFQLFGDGEQTRDFVFVKDVTQALFLAERNDEMVGKVFNVATGSVRTLNEAIADLEAVSGKKITMVSKPERTGDIKHSAADITRLRSFGYEPKYTFKDGAKVYWESL
ncbi:NAD-dependent epimerase/dehydratase family protein [Weissella confusa]|uniref:NAD-dependent epimerase/dehydratase family protein n=1 Tax=Weissella confusa TaxID=1583 RepID=UPI00168065BC|nr:NAD-dependent epimerase/dehydratase family protein [Weissella confusa]MBD1490985.1 NAD-dependent epimerase/dehydratase family protein [Weissella confusa]MBJ7662939.1 NAD-dependent epimerase/dehydratase family protein [Weissella confusa]MCT0025112.1 NAD-dependent epimerase/dehydratase family protein [Weissella confusa]